MLKHALMNLQKLRSSGLKALVDIGTVACLLAVYLVTEVAALALIQDPLYSWLTFFLITAFFSNLLAKFIASLARRS